MNHEIPQNPEEPKRLDVDFAVPFAAQFIALWEDRAAGDQALDKKYPDTDKMKFCCDIAEILMEAPDKADVGQLEKIFWQAVDKAQKTYEHYSTLKVTSLNQLTPLIRGILRQKLQEGV